MKRQTILFVRFHIELLVTGSVPSHCCRLLRWLLQQTLARALPSELEIQLFDAIFKLGRIDSNLTLSRVGTYSVSEPHCDVRHRSRTESSLSPLDCCLLHVRTSAPAAATRPVASRSWLRWMRVSLLQCSPTKCNDGTVHWHNLQLPFRSGRLTVRPEPFASGRRAPAIGESIVPAPSSRWQTVTLNRMHHPQKASTPRCLALNCCITWWPDRWNIHDFQTQFCRSGNFLALQKLGVSQLIRRTVSESWLREMYSVLQKQRYST